MILPPLSRSRRAAAATLAAGLAIASSIVPANAVPFAAGEVKGSFDTTVSFGGLYRLKDPSPAYYGITNTFNGVPGQQTSVNTDDGNLNYGKGWTSQLLKASHDLEVRYRDYGAFVRGYWFTDFKSDETRRTPLSDQAEDRVVQGAEFLDMYARARLTVGAMPFDLRIGRQVLSLGESTFIPNGINVVNPADVSKLRAPGSELKEALLPVNMVKASIGISDTVTIEPFWLLEFRRNELEPAGTYFSTNDFASRGGRNVFLGFGSLPDNGVLGSISREQDRDASNFNQYGVATRILAAGLNNTEFGLFYSRFHSRSPLISARTPTVGVDPDLTGPLTTAFIRGGVAPALAPAQAAAIFGLIVKSQTAPATLTPTEVTTLNSASVQAAIAGARQIALLTAAATGRYFIEFPENIDLFGVSFNSALGSTGISWQGELAYKHAQPLQIDDVELLFATLSSLAPNFGPPNNQVGSYLGQRGVEVSGYRRRDVWTTQTTLTKVFGPMLGSQQFTLLGEVGGVWANLHSKDTLRYEGPATFASPNAAAMAAAGSPTVPVTPMDAYADRFSWGYQLLGRFEYNNLFPNVNVLPTVAFTHDVKGNTPLPLGNYIHDRKSINLSVEMIYRNAWSLELRYVNFFGAGRYNLLGDRDYFASTVKYSF